MKKMGLISLVLVMAMGMLGVGYALWDKQLYIDGVVNTGEVNAVMVDVFTDDDGTVDDAAKDDGDDGGGTLYDRNGAASSDDPNEAGPNPTRYDKDVGMCTVTGEGLQRLTFTVTNGYPSYWNTCWFHIKNTGTVPVMINTGGLIVTPTNFTNGTEVTVGWDGDAYVGMQIDPYVTDADLVQCSINIHVEQAAAELDSYTFEAVIDLVQWNEYPYAPWPR